MAPLRRWARRGERLALKAPHGRWPTNTFIAALRHDRVEAPWLLDGPANRESFPHYVEKFHAPTLKPRVTVVMDNVGSHKNKAVRRPIRASGATLLFLPKYSPVLNPIEPLCTQIKHWLRSAVDEPATPSAKLSPRSSTPSHQSIALIISSTAAMLTPSHLQS